MASEPNKKSRKEKRPEREEKRKPEEKNLPKEEADEQENDFGGIPMRDLRKNLGCGG